MKPDPSTRKRSLIKGLSFEIISNIAGFALAYAWFGDFGNCLLFTGVCFAMKLVIFYYHERFWHQFTWGKKKHDPTTTVARM